MNLTAQLVRVLVRYVAGFLVAKGLVDAGTGDALASDETLISSIEVAVGLVLAGLNETWFALAFRKEK
jgi:hypothetical protein